MGSQFDLLRGSVWSLPHPQLAFGDPGGASCSELVVLESFVPTGWHTVTPSCHWGQGVGAQQISMTAMPNMHHDTGRPRSPQIPSHVGKSCPPTLVRAPSLQPKAWMQLKC